VFLIAPFGINPLLKLIESFCVSPTVISFGCTKVKNCVFFPEFGAGVTTGVGFGVTTGLEVITIERLSRFDDEYSELPK